MAIGDEARFLLCKHIYHKSVSYLFLFIAENIFKDVFCLFCLIIFSCFLPSAQCVDEWLRLNATCPTCRKSILPVADTASSSDQDGVATTTTTSSSTTPMSTSTASLDEHSEHSNVMLDVSSSHPLNPNVSSSESTNQATH